MTTPRIPPNTGGSATSWPLHPAHWVTGGFLLAIFFAPWGSVPRYAGWAISLIALLVLYLRGERPPGPTLNRHVALILGAMLLVGALTTAFGKQDLYLWVKGFSQLAEFAFSIWLAAWVLRHRDNGIRLWLKFWYAGTVLFLLWGVGQFFRGEELLFSNVNSLGLYICLILPLLLGVAFEPGRSLIDRSGRLAIAGIALVMLLLSHTATAWVTGGLQLLLFFLLLPACRRLLAGLLAATLVVSAFFLILTADSFTGVNGKTLKGEIKQLQTLLTGRADTDSSAARLDLMKLAARLGGQRPVVGWGWGRFDRESASFGDHPDFKRSEPVVFMGDAHSMYFNLWVRGGALALAGVLLIHLLGAWRLWQISRRPGGMELAIPALILLLSIFLYSLGGDIFQFRYKGAVLFWSVLGFAAMYRRELDDEAS